MNQENKFVTQKSARNWQRCSREFVLLGKVTVLFFFNINQTDLHMHVLYFIFLVFLGALKDVLGNQLLSGLRFML